MLLLCSFGLVEFSSVDEAKAVFDKKENTVLNEHTLFVDYGKTN